MHGMTHVSGFQKPVVKNISAGIHVSGRSNYITRAVLRLVWPFDGIVQN